MNSGIISMRYARALFEYALEKKVENTVFDEMKNLSESFSQNNDLRTTLDNPILAVNDKLELIKSAAGGNVSDALDRFIQLVLHRRRENHLQTISLLYIDLYRNHNNITVVRLVVATPIDDETVQKIKHLVQKDKSGEIELNVQIDPQIMGGFVLYLGTYRLDASVSSQLDKIRNQLLSKNRKSA